MNNSVIEEESEIDEDDRRQSMIRTSMFAPVKLGKAQYVPMRDGSKEITMTNHDSDTQSLSSLFSGDSQDSERKK